MCFGPRDPARLTVGASVTAAQKILARRLEKLRAAHERGDADRAAEKAVGVLRLCCAWSAPEPEGIAAPLLIASMSRAHWILAVVCGHDGDVRAQILADFLPTLLMLCQREHGVRSLEAADCLYDMAQTARSIRDNFAAIRWGREAAKLLLDLRGDSFYLPPAEVSAYCDAASWETFETAAGRASGCLGSHIDCLEILAEAHGQLPGQQKLAMSAATRHLALLDARFGRGHPLTVPGAYSMMSATFHNGSPCPPAK